MYLRAHNNHNNSNNSNNNNNNNNNNTKKRKIIRLHNLHTVGVVALVVLEDEAMVVVEAIVTITSGKTPIETITTQVVTHWRDMIWRMIIRLSRGTMKRRKRKERTTMEAEEEGVKQVEGGEEEEAGAWEGVAIMTRKIKLLRKWEDTIDS